MIWKIGFLLALWMLPLSVYAQNSIVQFKSGAVLMAQQLNQLQAGVVSVTNCSSTWQAWINQQANLATAIGEVFTEDMKAYAKAISAIANCADTTSTALPVAPTS